MHGPIFALGVASRKSCHDIFFFFHCSLLLAHPTVQSCWYPPSAHMLLLQKYTQRCVMVMVMPVSPWQWGEKYGGRQRRLIGGDGQLFVCLPTTDIWRWLCLKNNNQPALESGWCDVGWMSVCSVPDEGGCGYDERRRDRYLLRIRDWAFKFGMGGGCSTQPITHRP